MRVRVVPETGGRGVIPSDFSSRKAEVLLWGEGRDFIRLFLITNLTEI